MSCNLWSHPSIEDVTHNVYLFWNNNPANISMLDQLCFNVGDQRWTNVDPTLKMKQNPTSDFQLAQRWYNVSARRWNNVEITLHNAKTTLHNVGTTLIQRCFNLASTLVKAILNSIWLMMIVDCEIFEYMLNTWIVFILLNEKTLFYYILTIQLLMKHQKFF